MNKTKSRFGWTLRYTLINMSYFAVFCGIHAYASVFLQSKGFTNTFIGLCLTVANLLSVIIQPVIAGLIDKPGPLSNRNVSIISTLSLLVGSVLLYVIKNSALIIFIIYALIYMIQMAYQPLIVAMNFEYTEAGCPINFGLSRGLGSAGFAIFSAIIGGFVEKDGTDVLLISDAVILVMSLILLITFIKPRDVSVASESNDNTDPMINTDPVGSKGNEVAHNNPVEFAKLYPKFILLLIGIVCFFFAHNMINDFLIQIIRPLGGNEKLMGYAIFLAALLELPTMAFINVLLKKTTCERLLVFCGIMFFIKTLIITLTGNMVGVFISQACQMGAYAVLIPVSAYYVNQVLQKLDRVKGQAFINSAITLGGVFSGIICGKLLDIHGPKFMLVTGCIVTFAGLIITYIAVKPVKKNA
ncbi:MAG: MFS transporter [Lachnospiraceae bacterium]|nr:MFS transporter [Lachnospiraceae bacterium]